MHASIPDFNQMAQEAFEARERAKAEREKECQLAAGEVSLESSALLLDSSLDHGAKMTRLRAASIALRGEGASPVRPPAPAPVPLSANVLDMSTLNATQREIIELVAANPNRFHVEPFGAVKDSEYTKLRKNHEAASAATGSEGASTRSPEPAEPPAPPEPPVAPAKKAADKAPKKADKSDTPAPTPAEPPAPAESLARSDKLRSVWGWLRAGVQNTRR